MLFLSSQDFPIFFLTDSEFFFVLFSALGPRTDVGETNITGRKPAYLRLPVISGEEMHYLLCYLADKFLYFCNCISDAKATREAKLSHLYFE